MGFSLARVIGLQEDCTNVKSKMNMHCRSEVLCVQSDHGARPMGLIGYYFCFADVWRFPRRTECHIDVGFHSLGEC